MALLYSSVGVMDSDGLENNDNDIGTMACHDDVLCDDLNMV